MSAPSRRKFLQWGLAGAAGTAGLGVVGHALNDGAGPDLNRQAGSTTPASEDQRVLVVIEMDGGNDGLSTLAPYGNGTYHDLRPTLALDGDELSIWDDQVGLHGNLRGLETFGLAALVGVGAATPDLSHFEMQSRWWAGSPEGAGSGTGILGRFADQLCGDPEDPDAPPLCAVSVTTGPSPAVAAERVPTASIGSADGFGVIFQGDDQQNAAARRCVERLAGSGAGGDRLAGPRQGLTGVLRIADLLTALPDAPEFADSSDFASQLAFATQLIQADAGVRIIHVPMSGGSFDTHDGHRDTHTENMRLLGSGLAQFLENLQSLDLADRVLVATTSEFGRRAEEHNGGLDHGTASTALLVGPVQPGVHGEHPSLRDLDDDGNLRATVQFDRYLATTALWLGIDPAAVMTGSVDPLIGLLNL